MSASLEALDPEIRGFVREVMETSARLAGGRALDWPRRRAIAEQVRAPWRQAGPRMARTRDWDEPGASGGALRLRLHLPRGVPSPSPLLVYLHGGGWSMFSIDSHDRLMREYADAAAVAVLGIDYALSPEHVYPLALDQVVAQLRGLPARAAALGIDPSRIALGGDSAGANLALAAALRLRDGGGPALRGLLLNYGAFDARISAEAAALGTPEDMLSVEEMAVFWANYTGGDARLLEDPLVCPARARLDGLPPAQLVAAGRDVLCEQSIAMAARLREAGGEAALAIVPGMPHSFLEAMSACRQSAQTIAGSAAWLRARLA